MIEERPLGIVVALLGAIGTAVAALADPLGIGEGDFGWLQITGVIVGGLVTLLGLGMAMEWVPYPGRRVKTTPRTRHAGGVEGGKVRDVMTDRPRSATPDTPVSEAAQLMKTEDIGLLPILDGERLVGVVTDRDIVTRGLARGRDARSVPVREVASGELVTVRADDDLSDALVLMARHQVRRLPVVDEDDRLVGVLAQADIALGAEDETVGELVEEISKAPPGPRL